MFDYCLITTPYSGIVNTGGNNYITFEDWVPMYPQSFLPMCGPSISIAVDDYNTSLS